MILNGIIYIGRSPARLGLYLEWCMYNCNGKARWIIDEMGK